LKYISEESSDGDLTPQVFVFSGVGLGPSGLYQNFLYNRLVLKNNRLQVDFGKKVATLSRLSKIIDFWIFVCLHSCNMRFIDTTTVVNITKSGWLIQKKRIKFILAFFLYFHGSKFIFDFSQVVKGSHTWGNWYMVHSNFGTWCIEKLKHKWSNPPDTPVESKVCRNAMVSCVKKND
jgi:hypothetical protein